MRVVRARGDVGNAFRAAQAEAQAAFGVPDVYMEKYVEAPRHIEIQLIGERATAGRLRVARERPEYRFRYDD